MELLCFFLVESDGALAYRLRTDPELERRIRLRDRDSTGS